MQRGLLFQDAGWDYFSVRRFLEDSKHWVWCTLRVHLPGFRGIPYDPSPPRMPNSIRRVAVRQMLRIKVAEPKRGSKVCCGLTGASTVSPSFAKNTPDKLCDFCMAENSF